MKGHFGEKLHFVFYNKIITSPPSREISVAIFPPNGAGTLYVLLPMGPELYNTAFISAYVGGTEKLHKDEIIARYPSPKQSLRTFLWDPFGCDFLVTMCCKPAWLQLYAHVCNLLSIY